MRTPEELRALLDALPRPLYARGHVQIIGGLGDDQKYYTVGVWQSAEEALFMLQYMQEQKER